MKLYEIAGITGGRIAGQAELAVSGILTDSRTHFQAEGLLFVAIRGHQHNGHLFIPDLYKAGVRAFMLTDTRLSVNDYPEAGFVFVDDSLQALQQLATEKRRQFTGKVVGISGSNGKTIVKEWLSDILAGSRSVIRSPRSYNSQLGVPLSVWPLSAEYAYAVLEAGISQPGEMEKLEKVIQPHTGIFTNIGPAHQENFRSLEEKAAEKSRLFKACKEVIYCADQPVVRQALERISAAKGPQLRAWSEGEGHFVQLLSKEKTAEGCRIRTLSQGKEQKWLFPFSDEASLENLMHILTFCLAGELPEEAIHAGLARLEPVAMRMEMKKGINQCLLINDSYNSDTGALRLALDQLVNQAAYEKYTLILSDILQSGKEEKSLYEEVAQICTGKGVQQVVGIGLAISRHQAAFPMEGHFYRDTSHFLQEHPLEQFRREAILIKGSRRFAFERIVERLELMSHATRLEINLNVLSDNLNYYRSLLPPAVKTMVMVKAFAYGSGSGEIARSLSHQRVDYLGVAFTGEGVDLRRAGVQTPVMVMNAGGEAFPKLVRYGLQPEIYSLNMLKSFSRFCRKEGLKDYPVHLKLDTGMHRLGFLPEELDILLEKLKECDSIRPVSVFSHLAAADDPRKDDFSREQISLFKTMSQKLESGLGYPLLKHLLNTAGIVRFPEAAFDMVRLGIGLYGSNPARPGEGKTVARFLSSITQIKTIPAGHPIGYGAGNPEQKERRIAIIPLGYADGFMRNLGEGRGEVFVNGKRVPTTGRTCMDMTMLDVTGIEVSENDEVEIFGEHIPLEEVAERAGTIPYEILTGIPQRVKRIYHYE